MAMVSDAELQDALAAQQAGVRADLCDLVRIPSVSAPGFDPAQVRRSAEATAILLEGVGLGSVRLLEVDGAHPAVLGSYPAPAGAPTVLLYAHHDVQPTGPVQRWASPPFEPTERGGRLFGRGTADDKAGIAAHLAALRAWHGAPPVGVTVFIEGEEETGSDHLGAFLARYGDLLAADAVILADAGNWRVGEPAITTSLRGIVDCVVEVKTLEHAVHSGMYGGPLPDAIVVLARLLATLHDDAGDVAVVGLGRAPGSALEVAEDEFRRSASARPGVELIGSGSVSDRLWAKPAVDVLGIDAPSIRDASNQLVPAASAKVSVRLGPGDDPQRAMAAVVAHMQRAAPWGAEVTVTPGSHAAGVSIETQHRAFAAFDDAAQVAWGRRPVRMGAGGSIPFVAEFARAFASAALLLTGVEDPDTNAHSENESLHLDDFARYCLTEALFLGRFSS